MQLAQLLEACWHETDTQIWSVVLSKPIRGHKLFRLICEEGIYESVWGGRAMKTDPRLILVNLYQPIFKTWLWKVGVRQMLSFEVYSWILFQRDAWILRIFWNMVDFLTKVLHLYSTGGLTCYWRIHGIEWYIANYWRLIQTN